MTLPVVVVVRYHVRNGAAHLIRDDAVGPPFTSLCGREWQVRAAALLAAKPEAPVCKDCWSTWSLWSQWKSAERTESV